jgi:CheY-like chemotaxis protein
MALPAFSPQRVLAVDDCDVTRELLTIYLEAAGHIVRTAESGEQALDVARGEHFDAVILDFNMGGMSGVEVGNALRADPATCSSMIAMHTSETEQSVRSSGFGDFDAFLPKPCTAEELNDLLARMLQARQQP